MHQCQNYLKKQGLIDVTPSRPLSSAQANVARSHLAKDASALLYTAAVSIADAIRGLQSEFYTWATIKLYYSVFYSARAGLALNDIALVYEGTKPRTWKLQTGETLSKRRGTTHEVILKEFSDTRQNSFYLSQDIDLEKPLDWLRQQREEANYKSPKATEPNAPPHFQKLSSSGIRLTLSAYLSKSGSQYVFDPDHAMLSFPLLFWRDILAEARGSGFPDIVGDDADFLKEAFRDSAGPLADLHRIVGG